MINFTYRDSDSGSISLRQVALGYQPMVLIEPTVYEDEEGNDVVEFDIDSTDLSFDGFKELLELLLEAVTEGVITDVTEETEE